MEMDGIQGEKRSTVAQSYCRTTILQIEYGGNEWVVRLGGKEERGRM